MFRVASITKPILSLVALRNVYCQSPVYSSSRANFMTGRGPSQTANY